MYDMQSYTPYDERHLVSTGPMSQQSWISLTVITCPSQFWQLIAIIWSTIILDLPKPH